MSKGIPNKVLRAFNLPTDVKYAFIQLPPKGTTGIRGYIVPVEDLQVATRMLMSRGTPRFVVWRLVPAIKYVKKHREYIVKKFDSRDD